MVIDMIRRIAAAVLSLALVFGPGVNGAYAASMGVITASTAIGDAHSTSTCNDCGTAKAGMSVAPCMVSYCSGLTAFPPESKFLAEAAPLAKFAVGDARHINGRTEAPDPYPPRTTILN